MESKITIFKLDETLDIKGLDNELKEFNTISSIKVEKEFIQAALGDLAGQAINILISDPVQAITTVIELGGIIYNTLNLIKKAGKKLSINKGIARILAFTNIITIQAENIEKPVVYGPMVIQELRGLFANEINNYDYVGNGESAYLIAIAFPKEPKRTRTV